MDMLRLRVKGCGRHKPPALRLGLLSVALEAIRRKATAQGGRTVRVNVARFRAGFRVGQDETRVDKDSGLAAIDTANEERGFPVSGRKLG